MLFKYSIDHRYLNTGRTGRSGRLKKSNYGGEKSSNARALDVNLVPVT